MKKEVAENSDLRFRTKIQIALDLLRQSLVQVTPAVFVFDEWYMSQAKTNRLIQIDEEWIGLTAYARTLPVEAFTRVNAEVDEKRFKWF